MTNNISLKEQIDDLKKNPVFNMSLSGKELFHSNMLAMFLQQTKNEKTSEPTELAENMRSLFPPLLKDGEKEEDYVVFDVLREKFKFDLLIIYCTVKDIESLKQAKIEGYSDISFKNKKIADEKENGTGYIESEDESDSPNKINIPDIVSNFRYVIIENKFKSIPYKAQLNKYSEKITSLFNKTDGKSFEITKDNCKYYLFAPKESLNVFFGKDWKYEYSFDKNKEKVVWEGKSYEEFVSKLTVNSKNDDKFIIDFAKQYSNFLNIMLDLYKKEIIENIINKGKCFLSKEQNETFLSARIQDFYEKILFSRLLADLKNGLTLPENSVSFDEQEFFYANTDYSRQHSILNFRYAWKDDIYTQGIQIQNGAFEIVLCAEQKPFGIENKTADSSVLNDYYQKKKTDECKNEKDWILKIYEEISDKYPSLKGKDILKFKTNGWPYSYTTKNYAFRYACIDLKELTASKDYRDIDYDTVKELLKVALEVIKKHRYSSN